MDRDKGAGRKGKKRGKKKGKKGVSIDGGQLQKKMYRNVLFGFNFISRYTLCSMMGHIIPCICNSMMSLFVVPHIKQSYVVIHQI